MPISFIARLISGVRTRARRPGGDAGTGAAGHGAEDIITRKKAERRAAGTSRYSRQGGLAIDLPDSAREDAEVVSLLPVRRDPTALRQATTPRVLQDGDIPALVLDMVPPDVAHDQEILPFKYRADTATLYLAVARRRTADEEDALKRLLRAPAVRIAEIAFWQFDRRADLLNLLRHFYTNPGTRSLAEKAIAVADYYNDGAHLPATIDDEDGDEDAQTLRFVHAILKKAVIGEKEEIFIEPRARETRIRFCKDRWSERAPLDRELPLTSAAPILRILKMMCKPELDIFQTRECQEGTFRRVIVEGAVAKNIEFRVNITPELDAQGCTIRIQDLERRDLNFDTAVTCAYTNRHIRRAIASARGIVYIAAPVSNGKTTLAHTILRRPVVDTEHLKIVSIERGIEIINDEISQCCVDERNTEQKLLASHLRNAFDLLFVGEIRHAETARMAVEGAISGHPILTTLHTETAPGTILRLLNWGIDPHEVGASTNLVVCQRLVKRVCVHCPEPFELPEAALRRLGFFEDELGEVRLVRGKGCLLCNHKGVLNRTPVWETLPMTDDVRELVERGSPSLERELRLKAIEAGMTPLYRATLDAVKCGLVPANELVQFRPPSLEEYEVWRSVHRPRWGGPSGEMTA